MDLPQLKAFLRYWDTAPPVHELFAAFAGYKAPVSTQGTEASADDSDALLRDLAALGMSMPAGLIGAPTDGP